MKTLESFKTMIPNTKEVSLMSSNNRIYRMVLSAMFLALALLLPFLTMQIPQIGGMLCPMHIPVLLCGFFCGPWYALFAGAAAPLVRFALFGMPPLMPTGIAMCFELAAYGCAAGLLYRLLPKTKPFVYVSLLGAMLAGRIIWGGARVLLYGVAGTAFGWQAFLAGAFVDAIPGIIVQIVLIPILVIALKRYIRQ